MPSSLSPSFLFGNLAYNLSGNHYLTAHVNLPNKTFLEIFLSADLICVATIPVIVELTHFLAIVLNYEVPITGAVKARLSISTLLLSAFS